jgi:23S rRNA (cytosine1962-C5)-methyltransferase
MDSCCVPGQRSEAEPRQLWPGVERTEAGQAWLSHRRSVRPQAGSQSKGGAEATAVGFVPIEPVLPPAAAPSALYTARPFQPLQPAVTDTATDTDDIQYPALHLRKGEDRRLRGGHLWVFSNEVDVKRSPLDGFAPGDPAWIVDAADKPLGIGYVNPNSLICARLVDRAGHALDRSLIVHRLNVALALRNRCHAEPFYRLMFGESDGLPGLTVDRFDDVLVAQATTAGIERLKGEITDALLKVLSPRVLIWKNDSAARQLEGLADYVEVVHGEAPERVIVQEGGSRFEVDVIGGQKTGWFYDQRANRDLLRDWVGGARVLDLFSYVGAWGLRALEFGAAEATCVDSSADAVAAVRRNGELNRVGDRLEAVQGDVFEFLKAARAERRRWDVVILDPPAFVKRRKDFRQGALAYRRINEMAMQVLNRDGLLVSASCSHHMSRVALLDAIQSGARHLDRQVQVLVQLQQAPDHPIHAAVAETEYLKGYLCRVLPA